MNSESNRSKLTRGIVLWPIFFVIGCGIATDNEIESTVDSDGGIVATPAALTADGRINVLMIGNSQLAFGSVDLKAALEDFSAHANGGSNAMSVTLRQAFVGTCAAYRDPANSASPHPTDPIDASTDIVILEPPLPSNPTEQGATSCWDQFRASVPAGREFGMLVTNTTASGYYNPSTDPAVLGQGDVVLDSMVQNYSASRGALYIPASRYLRSIFGDNPDYATLDGWYQSDNAHPNPRAGYEYVVALYQFIAGRSVVGGPTSLAGFTSPVATTSEATAMQNFVYQLAGQSAHSAKSVSVATNSDGRLEAFFTSPSDVPSHVWQPSWAGERLAGVTNNRFKHQITAQHLVSARDSTNHLQVFYTGANSVLYRMSQNGTSAGTTWSDETLLGTAANGAKQLTVAENTGNYAGNYPEVFYIGTDDTLYHNWQLASGAWSGETMLGATAQHAKQLAVGRNSDGHLEVFYTGLALLRPIHVCRESGATLSRKLDHFDRLASRDELGPE